MASLRIYLVLFIVVVMTLILAPVHLLALWLGLPWMRTIPQIWHRSACFLIGIRLHVKGCVDTRRPLMLAANHASWCDILVMGALARVVFIAKSDMRDWPVFGWLARLQRTIFVEREEKRKAGAQVNDISKRLGEGDIVVLFPEGTTSDGNALLQFKTSLFGAASAAVAGSPTKLVHVQPVSIAYTGVHGMAMGHYHRPLVAWPGDVPLVSHLMGVLREGAIDVTVTFGESVDFTEHSSRKQLARTIEGEIRSMLTASLRGRDASQ
jgi:lyso-ornithine lipid O-acyltransferase